MQKLLALPIEFGVPSSGPRSAAARGANSRARPPLKPWLSGRGPLSAGPPSPRSWRSGALPEWTAIQGSVRPRRGASRSPRGRSAWGRDRVWLGFDDGFV